MKNLLIILFLTVGTNAALASTQSDSVTVDVIKVKEIIKDLKKRFEKSPDKNDKILSTDKVLYTYPKMIMEGERFSIHVLMDGELILVIGVDSKDYSLGEIIDLR